MGAGCRHAGLSAVQSHMTNTLNTPIEVLEMNFPIRLLRYALRDGSGGIGRHRGGDGLEREYHFLAPATVTLLTERRGSRPWGLAGGGPGRAGENRRNDRLLPAKTSFEIAAGERLAVSTPGGGGWGRVED
jgi:N-methylhydantoinase B